MKEEKQETFVSSENEITDFAQGAGVLRQGYYRTKGNYVARLDKDIQVRGLGVVIGVGFVAYSADGQFTYKDEPYENHPGDSLDLLVETWQATPFTRRDEHEGK